MRLFSKKPKTILFLGLKDCGKTSIIYSFIFKEEIKTIPTVGVEEIEVKINKKKFNFFDMTGCYYASKIWFHYYPYSDAVVYVIDINSLCDKSKYIEEVDYLKDVINKYNKKIVIVLTKYTKRTKENIEDIKNTLFLHIAENCKNRINSISIIQYDINDRPNEYLKNWLLKI